MKRESKKLKDTQILMQETRKEDTIRLRKKIEEFIYKANEDIKFIIKSKQELIDNINVLNVRLIKTEGALHILKILLEDK